MADREKNWAKNHIRPSAQNTRNGALSEIRNQVAGEKFRLGGKPCVVDNFDNLAKTVCGGQFRPSDQNPCVVDILGEKTHSTICPEISIFWNSRAKVKKLSVSLAYFPCFCAAQTKSNWRGTIGGGKRRAFPQNLALIEPNSGGTKNTAHLSDLEIHAKSSIFIENLEILSIFTIWDEWKSKISQ